MALANAVKVSRLVKTMPISITTFWICEKDLAGDAADETAEAANSRVSKKTNAPMPETNKTPDRAAASRR